MVHRHGFTLIETLITTLVLVTGLTALAAAFSYAVQTRQRITQSTTAIWLLYRKMGELTVDARLQPGQYSEDLNIGPDGLVVQSAGPPGS